MLSLLHHPNLVNLIGYCADGDQRLLVYEYMPLGSLEDHLHGKSFGTPTPLCSVLKLVLRPQKLLSYMCYKIYMIASNKPVMPERGSNDQVTF